MKHGLLLAVVLPALLCGCSYVDFQKAYGRTYVGDLFYKPQYPPSPMEKVQKRQAELAQALALWRQRWPEAEERYSVGPGDVLHVEVFPSGQGEGAQSLDVTVDDYGRIELPFIGSVDVSGLDTEQIETVLEKLYTPEYYLNPMVSVTVVAFRSKKIYVSGQVGRPGVQPLTKDRISVLEALLTAGGTTALASDEAIVTRQAAADRGKEGTQAEPLNVRINLVQLIEGKDLDQNVWLEDGDILHVPKEPEKVVTVVGFVRSPGVYPLPRDRQIGVMEAVARAGGPTSRARLENTLLVRKTDWGEQVFKVDLARVAAAKEADRMLVPGDKIIVKTGWLVRMFDGLLYTLRLGSVRVLY